MTHAIAVNQGVTGANSPNAMIERDSLGKRGDSIAKVQSSPKVFSPDVNNTKIVFEKNVPQQKNCEQTADYFKDFSETGERILNEHGPVESRICELAFDLETGLQEQLRKQVFDCATDPNKVAAHYAGLSATIAAKQKFGDVIAVLSLFKADGGDPEKYAAHGRALCKLLIKDGLGNDSGFVVQHVNNCYYDVEKLKDKILKDYLGLENRRDVFVAVNQDHLVPILRAKVEGMGLGLMYSQKAWDQIGVAGAHIAEYKRTAIFNMLHEAQRGTTTKPLWNQITTQWNISVGTAEMLEAMKIGKDGAREPRAESQTTDAAVPPNEKPPAGENGTFVHTVTDPNGKTGNIHITLNNNFGKNATDGSTSTTESSNTSRRERTSSTSSETSTGYTSGSSDDIDGVRRSKSTVTATSSDDDGDDSGSDHQFSTPPAQKRTFADASTQTDERKAPFYEEVEKKLTPVKEIKIAQLIQSPNSDVARLVQTPEASFDGHDDWIQHDAIAVKIMPEQQAQFADLISSPVINLERAVQTPASSNGNNVSGKNDSEGVPNQLSSLITAGANAQLPTASDDGVVRAKIRLDRSSLAVINESPEDTSSSIAALRPIKGNRQSDQVDGSATRKSAVDMIKVDDLATSVTDRMKRFGQNDGQTHKYKYPKLDDSNRVRGRKVVQAGNGFSNTEAPKQIGPSSHFGGFGTSSEVK